MFDVRQDRGSESWSADHNYNNITSDLETSFSSSLAAPLIHCHGIGGNSEPGDHREFDHWPEGKKAAKKCIK